MTASAIPRPARWALILTTALPSFAGLVQNPSFEATYNDQWPHYNVPGFNVEVWAGASGLNNNTGPFHNTGTAVPDQGFIGFKQGGGSVTQEITGLDPTKTYWLQYYYDARTGSQINMEVKWSGETVDTVNGILPDTTQKYRFRNVLLSPAADTGTLEFSTAVVGDSTILLDAVSIVQRDAGQVVLQNPSFEASGDLPDIGVAAGPIAGWAVSGTVGINTAAGPFANNGTIADQDHALFIQRSGSITQTIRGILPGKSYSLAMNVNARTGNTPHLLVTANGATVLDRDVAPVGGVAAYTNVSGTFTADSETVELVISQTVDATDQTLLVDNVRLAGDSLPPLPPLIIGPGSLELAPEGTGLVAVTVSKERLARGECVVILQSDNPGIAEFTDVGDDGTVKLTFPANGETATLTAEMKGLQRGVTSVKIVDNGKNDSVQGVVSVDVVTSFVRNGSFEGNAAPDAPAVGYGTITAWTQSNPGGSGLNVSGGPFANNGNIPDRIQVALMQGTAKISQMIYGLTPAKKYWLQFAYNARDYEGVTPNLHASIDGISVADILNIVPVGLGQPYYYHSVEFTAAAATAELAFSSDVTVGDGTVLLDGVSIVQRDAGEITVMNPSFEASGTVSVWPGYLHPSGIAGWTMAGGYGLNVDRRGPFTDNGLAEAQDRVLFMQNTTSATQTISGLTAGRTYNLSFLLNARNGDTAGGTPYQIVVDDVILEEGVQEQVGGDSPYNAKSLSFVATGETATIAFKCVVTPPDDQTLLLDDVHVTAAGAAASVDLSIASLAGNSVVLRWPATAPATLRLKTSTTLSGPWVTIEPPYDVVNGQNTVAQPFNGPRRFYQLFQP
ncbi:MAG: DUF642 domain-containing protein [Verrucomicrobiota bacterium]